ncbi:MAG: hypothetical protein IPF97_15520 [Sphingomonadales bacterium]|nr:hypothetical protein [Sphingomonadales bacterium]MBK6720076.1 hypothetical protein [Sphingomonadales bacterium]MBK8861048.1 hypothetical protein [Sphingomonadales bacterium]MBK9587064.1 hypothetical protein [Sphingomonadales bacterium]
MSGVLSVRCELAFEMRIPLFNFARSGVNRTKLAGADYHASSDTSRPS